MTSLVQLLRLILLSISKVGASLKNSLIHYSTSLIRTEMEKFRIMTLQKQLDLSFSLKKVYFSGKTKREMRVYKLVNMLAVGKLPQAMHTIVHCIRRCTKTLLLPYTLRCSTK